MLFVTWKKKKKKKKKKKVAIKSLQIKTRLFKSFAKTFYLAFLILTFVVKGIVT